MGYDRDIRCLPRDASLRIFPTKGKFAEPPFLFRRTYTTLKHSMFKIASAVQETLVCLRCQYRLELRRSFCPKPLRIYQTGRLYTVSSIQHQEQASWSAVSDDHGALVKSVITYIPYGSPPRTPPSGRKRNFNPIKDPLAFNNLGQPAEVLIVKDEQSNRDGSESLVEDLRQVESDAMSSSKMLKEMDGERGIIDPDQVCNNIDNLRDEWKKSTHILSESTGQIIITRRYEELASQLHKGFTTSQLVTYLESRKEVLRTDPLDLHGEFSTKVFARSSWRSGTTDVWRSRAPMIVRAGRNNAQRRKITRDMSEQQPARKRALAEKIIGHYWCIRPKEDESSFGEMDIRLQPEHLELLVNHSKILYQTKLLNLTLSV